ncbi:Cu-Zn family superoxide dismutase [Paenibacillus endophyticus]|uniref:Superoxide dismutase [Cu-Zn] n=1 Tax=Paenibacillus endophyticus TaxID=1294268 RepID=A0A7W5CBV1_9BACL|nr:superoxide dismutase family protein [Paenibacillus endophyticus]MBB3154846.1 Cu-Zn family superoxide dismutase [Paenibacillus endophyticus]
MKKIFMIVCLLLLTQAAGAAAAMTNSEPTALLIPIINGEGKQIGSAQLVQKADKVFVHIEAEKLAPGKHGVHFHSVGKCDTPDFKSAGDHYNPGGKQHGFNNPKGYHNGDLPNIEVGANGKVIADIASADVTLLKDKPNSLLKEGGTSLIIHEKADDYTTDPSGNSGNRVACGIIS